MQKLKITRNKRMGWWQRKRFASSKRAWRIRKKSNSGEWYWRFSFRKVSKYLIAWTIFNSRSSQEADPAFFAFENIKKENTHIYTYSKLKLNKKSDWEAEKRRSFQYEEQYAVGESFITKVIMFKYL